MDARIFNKAINRAALSSTSREFYRSSAQSVPPSLFNERGLDYFTIFWLGYNNEGDFTYGKPLNLSKGQRIGFNAACFVSAGIQDNEDSPDADRYITGIVKPASPSESCSGSGYLKQWTPECNYSFPLSSRHGLKEIAPADQDFGVDNPGWKVLTWQHVFSFGNACIPEDVETIPITFDKFCLGPSGFCIGMRAFIMQKDNPQGLIEIPVGSHRTLNFEVESTCPGPDPWPPKVIQPNST